MYLKEQWVGTMFSMRPDRDLIEGFETRVLTEVYHNPIFVLSADTLPVTEVNGGKKTKHTKKRLFKSWVKVNENGRNWIRDIVWREIPEHSLKS